MVQTVGVCFYLFTARKDAHLEVQTFQAKAFSYIATSAVSRAGGDVHIRVWKASTGSGSFQLFDQLLYFVCFHLSLCECYNSFDHVGLCGRRSGSTCDYKVCHFSSLHMFSIEDYWKILDGKQYTHKARIPQLLKV